MLRNSYYYDHLYEGTKGERIAAAYFTKSGWEVKDVRKIRDYQNKDIDFLLSSPTEQITVEVKYDAYIHRTNNVLLEDEDIVDGKKGWWHVIEADFLAFVSQTTSDIWIYRVSDLREYMDKGGKHRLSETRVANTHCFRNILINMDDFKAAGYHIQFVKGEEQC